MGSIAPMVEQRPFKPNVVGSNPSTSTSLDFMYCRTSHDKWQEWEKLTRIILPGDQHPRVGGLGSVEGRQHFMSRFFVSDADGRQVGCGQP